MEKFNVITWDVNTKEIVLHDILPYFRRQYQKLKKEDRPVTKDQWVRFIEDHGKYMYWARCEYEILISQWPPHPDPDKNKHIKIDVWDQIESNLSVIINILMSEVNYENLSGVST